MAVYFAEFLSAKHGLLKTRQRIGQLRYRPSAYQRRGDARIAQHPSDCHLR
jgi:hypothetical protein